MVVLSEYGSRRSKRKASKNSRDQAPIIRLASLGRRPRQITRKPYQILLLELERKTKRRIDPSLSTYVSLNNKNSSFF
jgi:hypothetical protein